MIRAIIFDCFGVLITDVLHGLRQEIAAINPEGAEEIQAIVHMKNKGILDFGDANERIAAILGVTLAEYRAKLKAGEHKNVELMQYIATLRRHYKTAMLSNITVDGLARRFTTEELAAHFDTVVASEAIGYAKPEPEAYEYVASALGVRLDECVFIDDRELFCEGARAVGMQAIEYKNVSQCKAELAVILSESS